MPAEGDWILRLLEGIREDNRATLVQLRSDMSQMRSDMNDGFERMRDEMQIQNGRVRKSEERILVIETERKEEDKQAVKRGVWTGIVASAGLTGILEIAKSIFHR